MATGKIAQGAEKWLFPKGDKIDKTTDFQTNGAEYTPSKDGVFIVRFYNGWAGLYTDGTEQTGIYNPSNTSHVATSLIKLPLKAGLTVTIWKTATVVEAYFRPCV